VARESRLPMLRHSRSVEREPTAGSPRGAYTSPPRSRAPKNRSCLSPTWRSDTGRHRFPKRHPPVRSCPKQSSRVETHNRASRPQREIWPMRDEIKRPMTQDENADDESDSQGAEEAPSGCRRQDRPHDHHDEAVAPWIRLEGEMRKRRIVGVHPHNLSPLRRRSGHNRSRPKAAATAVPSGIVGSTFLATNAAARCPMNTCYSRN